MRYALDTNAIVAALNEVSPVPARLAAVEASDLLLPAPAIAELYFGARASSRVVENVARVDRLLALFGLQPFDEATARRFAEVKDVPLAGGAPVTVASGLRNPDLLT